MEIIFVFYIHDNSIAHQGDSFLLTVRVKEQTKHLTTTTALAHIVPLLLQLQ